RSWFWNFGDGNTSTEQNPSHTYNQLGNFNVSLSVTDAYGCTDTLTMNNRVNLVRPVVRITNAGAGGCAPFNYRPVGSSSVPVTSWHWDLGNGVTHNGQVPPQQTYNPGNYTITLTITTEDGCTETVRTTIRVGTRVTPDFSSDLNNVCSGDEVQFTDLSSGGNGWIWDFGDGDTSHHQNPVHVYTGSGEYNVKLTVLNNGCPTEITKPLFITVNPPVAEFSYDNDCQNITLINFTNTSVLPSTGTIEYFWDFGNGVTSTAADTSIQYSGPGTYNVLLRVTDGICTSEVNKTLRLDIPDPGFSISKLSPCRNENFTLIANETNTELISSYEWRIGNNPPVTGGRSIT